MVNFYKLENIQFTSTQSKLMITLRDEQRFCRVIISGGFLALSVELIL